jgi:DNA-binding MarR family transcriptional regulator
MTEEELIKRLFLVSAQLRTETSEMPFFSKMSEGEKGIMGWLVQAYPKPILSGDIALKMNIGTGRVGNALKSLEKKGFIERKKDGEDLRKVYVYLTKEGYEKGFHLQKVIQSFLSELIEDVSAQRFESFLDDFDEIVKAGKKLRKRKEYQNVW